MARSLALLALAGAAAAAWPEEDNVVVLDDKNFDQFLKETPLTIVEFYAPWCGHCKELAPKWAEAAKRAKALSPPIPVAKVDADAHGDLAQRFGVSGYPTIKVFRDGLPEDYDGSREADGIVEYLKRTSLFKLVELKAVADLQQPPFASAKRALVFVGRQPVAASAAYKTFRAAAFALSSDADCAFGWSAAAAGKKDPVADALVPPGGGVPGVLLVENGKATASLKVPRKKDEFTSAAIEEWYQAKLDGLADA